MSKVTIDGFAKQIGVPIDKLLDQLEHAGITGKSQTDALEDDEKIALLQYLKGTASEKPATATEIR